MDINQMIERTERRLVIRQVALKRTLDELETLQTALKGAKAPPDAIAIRHAIAQAQTKRDRQNNAVLASEGVIKSLKAVPTNTVRSVIK